MVHIEARNRDPGDVAGREHPQALAQRAPRRRRILVVDDYAANAKSLAHILELWGHTTSFALDGVTAVELARAYEPDTLLLDLNLPDMDGFQLARILRDDARFADATFFALTGRGDAESESAAMAAGFTAFMLKPVDLDALQALLGGPFGGDSGGS